VYLVCVIKKHFAMPHYNVQYTDKQVVSIHQAGADADPTPDTILEERTGQIMYATIQAEDDAEARRKAERLQTELQTGRTARDVKRDEDGNA
jgi:hypothetical protein